MQLNDYFKIKNELPPHVTLLAVSKTKPVEDIRLLFDNGQLHFGENKVQELIGKQPQLPHEIKWHLIGHLQSNKVKYIAPFVEMIHSVDSFKLLKTIDTEAQKCNRIIKCLLQVHIAEEDTKYGLSENELIDLVNHHEIESLKNITVNGLMGMATYTDDFDKVRLEFRKLKNIFTGLKNGIFSENTSFTELSMGMSGDYQIAVEEGATIVRLGSIIFGERVYPSANL